MAKERNEAQKKAAELLQHIPIVECELMKSKPFYKDNRTKNVRVCKINDDLWVPTTELANGHPNSNRGGDWGNGLVMGLTKATSYLLIALDRQGKKEKGKPSIIEFYQAMLPVCLDIAKNDIEQKEAIALQP